MSAALELKGLRKSFGKTEIIRGVDLAISEGERHAVIGPNGAGKSTLLRLIAGLLPLSGGDVRLGEVSLASDRAALQERTAYAGHLDAVKPALTVHQNLAHWAAIFGDNGDVDAALAFFGLERIADRPAAQCSAGQKRRLGLARLRIMNRPLWLLDEPTVSLDTDSSALVAGMVRAHCATGGLALIATHIDLGLGDAAILDLAALSRERAIADETDAFLSGDWG